MLQATSRTQILGTLVIAAAALLFAAAPFQAHASVPATYKFTYQEQMVQFINSLGKFDYVLAHSVRANGTNASKLCSLKGYATVAGYTVRKYSSPWNNIIATWSNHSNEWKTENAGRAGNPGQFDTLTCSNPYGQPTPTPTPTATPTPTPTHTPTPAPESKTVVITFLINGQAKPAPIVANTAFTLSWSATHAKTCVASRDWSGDKGTSGSVSITPTEAKTYSYRLDCSNKAGATVHKTINLTVNGAEVDPTPTPTPSPTPTPTPTPTIFTTCVNAQGKVVAVSIDTLENCNVNTNTNTQTVSLSIDNSANNSADNSSNNSSENKAVANNSGNSNTVNVEQEAGSQKVAKIAGAAAYHAMPVPGVPVPVTAKTGAGDIATLAFSTLSGGTGLTYVIRKFLLG